MEVSKIHYLNKNNRVFWSLQISELSKDLSTAGGRFGGVGLQDGYFQKQARKAKPAKGTHVARSAGTATVEQLWDAAKKAVQKHCKKKLRGGLGAKEKHKRKVGGVETDLRASLYSPTSWKTRSFGDATERR